MKRLQKFFHKWILVPNRRYILFTGISFVLAFLIPILGWNPLLLLWIINGCLCYKEAKSSKNKFFYIILVILFGVLFTFNLCLRFSVLMQYFGVFTWKATSNNSKKQPPRIDIKKSHRRLFLFCHSAKVKRAVFDVRRFWQYLFQ